MPEIGAAPPSRFSNLGITRRDRVGCEYVYLRKATSNSDAELGYTSCDLAPRASDSASARKRIGYQRPS